MVSREVPPVVNSGVSNRAMRSIFMFFMHFFMLGSLKCFYSHSKNKNVLVSLKF